MKWLRSVFGRGASTPAEEATDPREEQSTIMAFFALQVVGPDWITPPGVPYNVRIGQKALDDIIRRIRTELRAPSARLLTVMPIRHWDPPAIRTPESALATQRIPVLFAMAAFLERVDCSKEAIQKLLRAEFQALEVGSANLIVVYALIHASEEELGDKLVHAIEAKPIADDKPMPRLPGHTSGPICEICGESPNSISEVPVDRMRNNAADGYLPGKLPFHTRILPREDLSRLELWQMIVQLKHDAWIVCPKCYADLEAFK